MNIKPDYSASVLVIALAFAAAQSTKGGTDVSSRPKAPPSPTPCVISSRRPRVNTLEGTAKKEELKKLIDTAKESLESLRERIEEWGVVTASAPIVMSVRNQFNLGAPSDFPTVGNYINNERTGVAGSSFISTETGFSNQFGASLQGTFQKNAATGLTEPVLATGSNAQTGTASLPPLNINNTLLSGSTAAPGTLGGNFGVVTGIPERTAVILGVNDKMTENILTTMANPPWDKFVNQDYDVSFAIIQISCNPGWRTRYNYIADISASCDYYSSCKHRMMPENQAAYPLVFSVMPLLDAQNLDLGSSDRNITALAAQVSASYPTIGLSILGQDLITFVHRYQKDNRTRTPMTVTNSYSTGRTFGFRFAPSFLAQKDPAAKKSGAANVLQATTIPVLVTVVTNRNDYLSGGYDEVIMHFSNRWLINDRPPLTAWYKRLWTPLEREDYDLRMGWAGDVAHIKSVLAKAELCAGRVYSSEYYEKTSTLQDTALDYSFDPVLSELRDETLAFEAKTNSDVTFFKMGPKDSGARIEVTDTEPQYIPATDAFNLVIHGKYLNNIKQITLGGKIGQNLTPLYQNGDGESALLVSFPQGPMVEKRVTTITSGTSLVLLKSGTEASVAADGAKLAVVTGSLSPSLLPLEVGNNTVETGSNSMVGRSTSPIALLTGSNGAGSPNQIISGTIVSATTDVTADLVMIGRHNTCTTPIKVAPAVADKAASTPADPKTVSISVQRDPNGNVTSLTLTPSQLGFGGGSTPAAAKPAVKFSTTKDSDGKEVITFKPGADGIVVTGGTGANYVVSAKATTADGLEQANDGSVVVKSKGFQVSGPDGIFVKNGSNIIHVESGSNAVLLTSGTDNVTAPQGSGVSIVLDGSNHIPQITGNNSDITFIGGTSGVVIATGTYNVAVLSAPKDAGSPASSGGSGSGLAADQLMQAITQIVADPHKTVIVPNSTPASSVSVKAQ